MSPNEVSQVSRKAPNLGRGKLAAIATEDLNSVFVVFNMGKNVPENINKRLLKFVVIQMELLIYWIREINTRHLTNINIHPKRHL